MAASAGYEPLEELRVTSEAGDRAVIMDGIERLNDASRKEALTWILACCGSTAWAKRLVEARPFADLRSLEESAEVIAHELSPGDWLEAVNSHPRIGARTETLPRWSAAEQAGIIGAKSETLLALAAATMAYEEKFSHIFILCATGKSSEEMLSICRERLENDPDKELRIASEELRKIAKLRLRKLIERTNQS
jgi:OHCU decarboxylase